MYINVIGVDGGSDKGVLEDETPKEVVE